MNLYGNEIGAEGARYLADALKYNTVRVYIKGGKADFCTSVYFIVIPCTSSYLHALFTILDSFGSIIMRIETRNKEKNDTTSSRIDRDKPVTLY